MIYIRDDDVLVPSNAWTKPFEKFKQVHEWTMLSDKVMHVPTVLTKEIQQFPECIEYIKSETKLRNMQPQLHGLRHVDPGKLSFGEVRDQLKEAKEWMFNVLEVMPTKWYTPWGAGEAKGQEYIWEASNLENLEMVTCKNVQEITGRDGIIAKIRAGLNPHEFLENKDIMVHWWQRGVRLKKVIEFLENGKMI